MPRYEVSQFTWNRASREEYEERVYEWKMERHARTLEVIFPIRTRLPDIEDGAWNPFAREVPDSAVHERHASALGRGIHDDAPAQLAERCIGRPEGPQDGRGSWVGARFGDDFVGDFVD